ncbi:MAG: DUF4190 domain-containing protein [Acidimicrobiia bacterium]|nr:DUF4190 domain-containing protein [Acidimicrobiia bacterium]
MAFTGQKNSGHALAGLILGICGIILALCCAPLGIVVAILAVVFGFLGKKQVDGDPALYRGRGMALAGIICGFVGVGIAILGFILFLSGVINTTWNWETFESTLQALGSARGLA